MAPGPSEQLGTPPTLVLFRFVDRLPLPATPCRSPTCQRGDNHGVNDDLLASPERQAVGDDLNPTLVICLHHNVEIAKQLVFLHTSSCFAADSGHAHLDRGPSRLQETDT